MPKLDDYLTIKEAADFLAVSANTLRNWGASGKIPVHRNPMNGYRLYKVSDLQGLLDAIESSARPEPKIHTATRAKHIGRSSGGIRSRPRPR